MSVPESGAEVFKSLSLHGDGYTPNCRTHIARGDDYIPD